MADRDDFNVYADVDREAMHDHDPRDMEPDERPTRGEVADLEPPPPFAPHPREVKIGDWTYIPCHMCGRIDCPGICGT